MSELKDKLLQEDQANIKVEKDEQQQPQKAGEQQEQADFDDNFEPAPIVVNLKNKFENWELKLNDGAGLVFFVGGLIVLSLMRLVRNIVMPENTNIEIAFIAFLTAFLVNYYLVRVGNILPYIENEQQNFTAKVVGFSMLSSIIFLLYSFQHTEVNSCAFIFILCWVVSYFTERIYFRSGVEVKDLGLIMLLTCCAYLLLQPSFLLDYTGNKESEEMTPEEIADQANNFTNKQQIGLIAACFSSFFFSYMCFNIKKLRQYDYITLTHIICLIVVLFLPVFFPIEGLKSPNAIQWAVMVGFGLVFMILLQLFIRAVQLEENSSKLLGQLPLYLGLSIVCDFFLGKVDDSVQLIGAAVAIVCSLLIIRRNSLLNSKALPQDNTVTGSQVKGQFVELKNINSSNNNN